MLLGWNQDRIQTVNPTNRIFVYQLPSQKWTPNSSPLKMDIMHFLRNTFTRKPHQNWTVNSLFPYKNGHPTIVMIYNRWGTLISNEVKTISSPLILQFWIVQFFVFCVLLFNCVIWSWIHSTDQFTTDLKKLKINWKLLMLPKSLVILLVQGFTM